MKTKKEVWAAFTAIIREPSYTIDLLEDSRRIHVVYESFVEFNAGHLFKLAETLETMNIDIEFDAGGCPTCGVSPEVNFVVTWNENDP